MASTVDEQRMKNYRARVTTWIGRQGIFFQIRYVRLTSGGSLASALISLATTLGVLLIVAAGLTYGALKYYQGSEVFEEKLDQHLAEVLGAESLETKGFSRTGGNALYRRLNFTGGERSFFYEAKVEGLKGEMPFFTGLLGDWSPSVLTIDKADFLLKAGGRQKEMETAMSGILESLEGTSLERIKIADLSCEWGYSKLTFGGFYNTSFEAALRDGQWVISVEGGYFRQNWIGPFDVKRGVMKLGPDGIEVESLVLASGEGKMEFEGAISGPLEMPKFDLTGTFTGFPVEKMFEIEKVPEERFIEGTVSGQMKVSGSTNRRIETEGRVVLGEGDKVLIRDQWKLLRAITAVGTDGTYLRIGFGKGSFDFSSSGGGCKLSNIDLSKEGAARLTGEFSTRLPSQKEAAEFLNIKLTDGFSKSLTDTSSAQELEDDRLSIRRVSKDENGDFGIELNLEADEESLEDIENLEASIKQIDGLKIKREMSRPRFTGKLNLAVPAAVFAENKNVAAIYPVDEGGWCWIPVEFKDEVFSKLSRKASDKLLKEGQIYRPTDEGTGAEN